MEKVKENEAMKARYQNVPLDFESYQILESLCKHYGLGRRAKGAFVSRLLREEKRKLEALQTVVSSSDLAA